MEDLVMSLGAKVLNGGYKLARDEALSLCDPAVETYDLMYWANKIRAKYKGEAVRGCSIISVKTGACTEDCTFCSQSARYKTGSPVHGLVDPEQIAEAAKKAKEDGSYALGIVAQGRAPSDKEIDKYIEYMDQMEGSGVEKHLNIGALTDAQIKRLKAHGMVCCGHNLETSRRFFPEICTTHTYDERIETLRALRENGVRICSGGLFGMGEEWADRVDMAIELRDAGADNVPMNFLNSIEGTPLEKQEPMTPLEILRTIAIYRLILFDRDIGVYGGREVNLRDLQAMIFFAGANALMVGNYLTTAGRPAEVDRQMVADLKLKMAPATQLEPLP